MVAAALIAIGLEFYFNRYNRSQLETYARNRQMMPMTGAGKGAYEGRIKGIPVALAAGGTFYINPAAEKPQERTYISWLVIQISLKNER